VTPVITVTKVITQVALLDYLPGSGQGEPVLGGLVSDGGGVGAVMVRITLPDGDFREDTVDWDGAAWRYTPTLAVDGDYLLRVKATDRAGNTRWEGPFALHAGCASVDLTADFVDAELPAGALTPITMTLQVTHNGGDEVAAGLPVAIYIDGNLIDVATTSQALAADQSERLGILWNAALPGEHQFRIQLNDDGSGLGPFNLCPMPATSQDIDIYDAPLVESWNLISSYVNPIDTDIVVVQRPITGTYRLIQSFDLGAKSYYPDLQSDFNTLTDMDAEHGYWIRVDSGLTPTLRIVGRALPEDHPLSLAAGWNLVSYLPRVTLPITVALQSIVGQYTVVLGFDHGAQSYYPDLDPGFNTLQTMRPGRGYWIRTTAAVTLTYPSGNQLAARYDQMPDARRPVAGDDVLATNQWVDFYGVTDAPEGAVIRAIDPDGVTCGAEIVITPGEFGLLPCYGDDPDTPEDEGAVAGDVIRLVVEGRTVATGVWSASGERQEVTTGPAEASLRLFLPMIAASPLASAQNQPAPADHPLSPTPDAIPTPPAAFQRQWLPILMQSASP